MFTIRDYVASDAPAVGRLIADTYSAYNLTFVPKEELGLFLGPFRHAHSPDPAPQAESAATIASATVLGAEADGEIIGVLRGRPERLASLFVRGDWQRRGVGRALVARFEALSRAQGVAVIRVEASLAGEPFLPRLGLQALHRPPHRLELSGPRPASAADEKSPDLARRLQDEKRGRRGSYSRRPLFFVFVPSRPSFRGPLHRTGRHRQCPRLLYAACCATGTWSCRWPCRWQCERCCAAPSRRSPWRCRPRRD